MDATMLWSAALIGVVIVLFGLPLVPALLELRADRRAEPVFIDAAGSALIPRTGQHLDEIGASVRQHL